MEGLGLEVRRLGKRGQDLGWEEVMGWEGRGTGKESQEVTVACR